MRFETLLKAAQSRTQIPGLKNCAQQKKLRKLISQFSVKGRALQIWQKQIVQRGQENLSPHHKMISGQPMLISTSYLEKTRCRQNLTLAAQKLMFLKGQLKHIFFHYVSMKLHLSMERPMQKRVAGLTSLKQHFRAAIYQAIKP